MDMHISTKRFYDKPIKDGVIPDELAYDAFMMFASRHKHDREICPAFQETRNESHTAYGFHTSILAVSRKLASFDELKEQFTHCTGCGACDVRDPNNLLAGDYYMRTTTNVDLVRKVRHDFLSLGNRYKEWAFVSKHLEDHKQSKNQASTRWADGLGLPNRGSTILFVDCLAATQTPEIPRATAKLLRAAGVKFGVLSDPWDAGAEAVETGQFEVAEQYARHNVQQLKDAGAETVIIPDAMAYETFYLEYPKAFSSVPFKTTFATDYLDRLVKEGMLKLTKPVKVRATYNDTCSLNKRTGIWESPRNLLRSVPELKLVDENHVEQWWYCCGNKGGYKQTHPAFSRDLASRRLKSAADLDVDSIVVGFSPRCSVQFREVSKKNSTPKLLELSDILATSAGV
jgi:Fe-S oxidoreductase